MAEPIESKTFLRLAISASGVRYTRGALEWWEHQGAHVVFLGLQQR